MDIIPPIEESVRHRPFHWTIPWAVFLVVAMPWLGLFLGTGGIVVATAYYRLPALVLGGRHFTTYEWNTFGPSDAVGIILTALFYGAISVVLGSLTAWFLNLGRR